MAIAPGAVVAASLHAWSRTPEAGRDLWRLFSPRPISNQAHIAFPQGTTGISKGQSSPCSGGNIKNVTRSQPSPNFWPAQTSLTFFFLIIQNIFLQMFSLLNPWALKQASLSNPTSVSNVTFLICVLTFSWLFLSSLTQGYAAVLYQSWALGSW